jgi:hypothetical protein
MRAAVCREHQRWRDAFLEVSLQRIVRGIDEVLCFYCAMEAVEESAFREMCSL